MNWKRSLIIQGLLSLMMLGMVATVVGCVTLERNAIQVAVE